MTIPMCLGPYMFHATNFGFNGLSRNVSTNWAEIEVVGGLNVAQWTGGQSDKISIKGVLFPEEFGGQATMGLLQRAAFSAMVLPLISLSGKVYGNFRIDSVDEEQGYHDHLGRARMNVYTIALTYHRGPPTSGLSIIDTLFG